MAACRGFFECLLRLLNFFLTVAGLAMVGYGIYLLVEWMKISGGVASGGGSPAQVLVLGRPLLGAVALGDSFLDKLPKAWFIYLFIGVGAIVFLVSLFGCIGAGTRNTCCLCFVSSLVCLLGTTLFSFLKKMPFAMHKMLKSTWNYVHFQFPHELLVTEHDKTNKIYFCTTLNTNLIKLQ